MTLFEWKRRRIVEVDAHGDRRVYWRVELSCERQLALGLHWWVRADESWRLGRWDRVSCLAGPLWLLVERTADPR